MAKSKGSRIPPDPTGGKRALVLAGGGISGFAYEIGALRALDDVLVGATVNDFDIYVGTSAGAIIGALLANGITPTEMALAFRGDGPRTAPTQWTIYRPNVHEVWDRVRKIPGLAAEITWELMRHPARVGNLNFLGMLLPLLPSGLFNSERLVEYMQTLFQDEGMTDDFRKLDCDLNIVACELDSGQRTVFGKWTNQEVPISVAAAASSAVPILYRPMRIDGVDYIDGGIKGISAIDVAVERGATMIVVINPVVPLDANKVESTHALKGVKGQRIADLGLRGIYNQVFRGMLHDGMVDHIHLVRDRYPHIDILLIEPRPDDQKMFFHELMSYSARLMVLQHGYESVSNGLYETWGYLRRILPKHGIHITRRNIDRKPVEVPVESIETPGLFRRLLSQTVFDRRPHVQVMDDDEKQAS